MIISQTPYRISFAGGGTDLPAFYREEFGAVLSMTIARHMYVTVHSRFESNIRVAYSRTEIVDSRDEIQHELVREAMRLTGVDGALEFTTIGDVPGGTGMGSSSTLTVGLLNALYAYSNRMVSSHRLADEACQIEIDMLGKPIGKQDQYAAAFGGINYFCFNPDHSVDVTPVPVRHETTRDLEDYLLLFYTNRRRSADEILQRQSEGTQQCRAVLREMRDLANEMREVLLSGSRIEEFAVLLHQGWQLKRSLGFGIANAEVDRWYAAARNAGALGGKVLGAGGGGFLLLMAPPECHDGIRIVLGHPKELHVKSDRAGSRIVFINEQHEIQSPVAMRVSASSAERPLPAVPR